MKPNARLLYHVAVVAHSSPCTPGGWDSALVKIGRPPNCFLWGKKPNSDPHPLPGASTFGQGTEESAGSPCCSCSKKAGAVGFSAERTQGRAHSVHPGSWSTATSTLPSGGGAGTGERCVQPKPLHPNTPISQMHEVV